MGLYLVELKNFCIAWKEKTKQLKKTTMLCGRNIHNPGAFCSGVMYYLEKSIPLRSVQ